MSASTASISTIAIFKKLGNGSEASPGKLKKAYFEVGTEPMIETTT